MCRPRSSVSRALNSRGVSAAAHAPAGKVWGSRLDERSMLMRLLTSMDMRLLMVGDRPEPAVVSDGDRPCAAKCVR